MVSLFFIQLKLLNLWQLMTEIKLIIFNKVNKKNRQQILSDLFLFWCISLQQGEPVNLTQMGRAILKFRDTNMKYTSGYSTEATISVLNLNDDSSILPLHLFSSFSKTISVKLKSLE